MALYPQKGTLEVRLQKKPHYAVTVLVPEIGITGTPVIDPSTNTIYLVASTKENGNFVQRMHTIDLITHAEKFDGHGGNFGHMNGTGDGSSGGKLSFDPPTENQRPGLLLENSHRHHRVGSAP